MRRPRKNRPMSAMKITRNLRPRVQPARVELAGDHDRTSATPSRLMFSACSLFSAGDERR